MHYPLAMLLLALMDQRACKELEEPGSVQQNNGQRRKGQKAGRRRWREEVRERDGGRWGGCWRGLWGSQLSERRQLDPPERRQLYL